MNNFFILLITTFLSACVNNEKYEIYNALQAIDIDKLMINYHAENLFNGSILVAEKGKVIYQNALGSADFDSGRELDLDTSFYIASVSKPFTAMAVMMLKEDGLLSYDDKLSKYFSVFPKYADRVTIAQLLRHTSGIPDYFTLEPYDDIKNSDVLAILASQEKLDFEPGDKFSYSNSGYALLSLIIEQVSGQKFHKFLTKRIFEPLKMTRTLVFDESKPQIDNRAVGYNRTEIKNDYRILTTGDGGIYSTVGDLHKWDRALYTEQLISKTTMDEAFFEKPLNDGTKAGFWDGSGYGFGWMINKNIVKHSGGLFGYRAYIERQMEREYTIIILTNKGDALDLNDITSKVSKILSNYTIL